MSSYGQLYRLATLPDRIISRCKQAVSSCRLSQTGTQHVDLPVGPLKTLCCCLHAVPPIGWKQKQTADTGGSRTSSGLTETQGEYVNLGEPGYLYN